MKIFKLFINENIKIWKKFSTKLLIVAVILSLVGVLGLAKLMEKIDKNAEIYDSSIHYSEENIKSQIEYFKTELKNDNLDENTKKSIQMQLTQYEMYLEYKVSPYGNTWKNTIISEIATFKSEGKDLTTLTEILKNNDYNRYMEEQKDILKKSYENKEIEEQTYKDELEILELKRKYEIGKENNDKTRWKRMLINEISTYKESLKTGIYNQKVLTVEKKQELEEDILINMYRLEHDIPTVDEGSNTNFRLRFEILSPMFVIAVLSIVAVIIAGGTISSEVSNGTIKFWALTPNRRWKILTAKLLSVLFYIVVITLVMSILSVIFANVFFDEPGDTYLYVSNGEVKEIGNTLYTIEYYFAKAIPVVIFALFAVMLSTVTRNTAVSVSVSIALYMGSSIFMAIINQFVKKDWIRFVPLNNLNIADKIFTNTTNIMSMGETSFATSTSLGFSLAVLGVCAVLMLITMYDSFNKRDII